MLICVVGKKRAGKDTVKNILIRHHGYRPAQKFAQPFKTAFLEWFDWNEAEHFEGGLKEVVDPEWGFSPRQILQIFGTELMKEDLGKRIPLYAETVGRAIWAKIFVNWYKKQPRNNYVLSDMRFPEEFEALRDAGINFKIVKVIRNTVEDQEDMHESEQYIDWFHCDAVVYNNYGFPELEDAIDKLEIIREQEWLIR